MKFILPIVLVSLLMYSCSKEYSCEGCYSIPDNQPFKFSCRDFSMRGLYEAGHALTSQHQVFISANVSSGGSFSIRTDTINGVYFSAAGILEAGLDRVIIFTGSGTPELPGKFEYSFNDGSCSFMVSYEDPASSSAVYFYEAVIDGEPFYASFGNGGGCHMLLERFTPLTMPTAGLLSSAFVPATIPPAADATSFKIYRGYFRDYDLLSRSELNPYFARGLYNYADLLAEDADPLTDGVTIVWTDTNGVEWTSAVTDINAGTFFSIDKVVQEPAFPRYTLKLNISFSCKILNASNQAKIIRNGRFFGLFQMH